MNTVLFEINSPYCEYNLSGYMNIQKTDQIDIFTYIGEMELNKIKSDFIKIVKGLREVRELNYIKSNIILYTKKRDDLIDNISEKTTLNYKQLLHLNYHYAIFLKEDIISCIWITLYATLINTLNIIYTHINSNNIDKHTNEEY